MTSTSDRAPERAKAHTQVRRGLPRAIQTESVIGALVLGSFVIVCCAVAGGLFLAMMFGLFTLDVDSAYRAIEVMFAGVIFIMIPVGLAAGLLIPLILWILRVGPWIGFSKTGAVVLAALSGLFVLFQAANEFNELGNWIGIGLGAVIGVSVTVMLISDERRGRTRNRTTRPEAAAARKTTKADMKKKQSNRIVGSLLIDGAAQPFSFDLATDRLELDAKTIPNPGQPALDGALRERLERVLRESASGSVQEVRFGEYFCPQCRRWINVTGIGAWSLSECAKCVLDRGSELHEHYAAASSPKPPAPPREQPEAPPVRSRRTVAPAAVTSDPPAADYYDDQLGVLIHRARATVGIKVLCLLAGLGALSVVAIVWPEFKMRFGGVMGWLLNLRHNPAYAAPGIMLFVAFGCGIWALRRFAYYLRARVEVREYGIRVSPGSRQAFWEDIDEIRYAKRRLRGSPVRESLQLRPRDQRPINLSHRFNDMDELISIVRAQVEPRLIELACGAIACEGSASFGSLVTIAQDRLILGVRKKELPLDQVGKCGVQGGQFSVTDRDGRLVFARGSEFIPSATIVGVVVSRVRSARW